MNTDPDPDANNFVIIAILILFILLLLSAFFSMTETAYSSFNKIRLENMAKKSKSAKLVLKISNNFDRVLSTLLIGNNIVNIAASSLATVLFTMFYDDLGPTLATLVLTIVILIFGEVTPKTIARENPETCVKLSVYPLYFFYFLFYPLSSLLSGFTFVVKKILTKKEKAPVYTEEEFSMLVEDMNEDGVLNDIENDIIQNTIEYGDTKVSEIMVGSKNVVHIKDSDSIDKISKKFISSHFSRLVVCKTDSLQTAYGFLHQKDFFELRFNKGEDISNVIMNEPIICKPSHKISRLLKKMQSSRQHLAFVKDNNDKFVGIVTMEDILEELVGEINDETDED